MTLYLDQSAHSEKASPNDREADPNVSLILIHHLRRWPDINLSVPDCL